MSNITTRWNAEGWILNSQEEITELMLNADAGHGCKGCDARVSDGPWCQIEHGEIFCWTCALDIDTQLTDVVVRTIPTTDQIRRSMEMAAQGISAN